MFIPFAFFQSDVVYDPDAQAYINAANITNTTQKDAVNELIINLKKHGIWGTLHAMYPILGGSSQSHSINAKNPGTYNLGFSTTGWTHSSTGAFGNGVNGQGWANTFFMPASSSTSICLTLYSRQQNVTKDGYAYGVYTAGNNAELTGFPLLLSNNTSYAGFGVPPASFVTSTGKTASGLWAFQHSGGSTTLHKNGAQLATGVRTRVNPTASIHINCIFRPNNAAAAARYDAVAIIEWAFASIGTSLTGTSHSRLWDSVTTFQQKLNRTAI